MIKAALKSALAHRLRLALTTVAVMLGVTFVSGTLIYTDTLNSVFTAMVEEGTSSVDVYVKPHAEFESITDYGSGGPSLPESLIEEIRRVPGVASAEGAVSGYAQFVDKDGKAVTPMGPPTLGMSWTRDSGLSTVRLTDGKAPETSLEVAMDSATAERFGFSVGDEVELLLQGPKETFELVGIFERESGESFAGATLAAFDLDTAQRVLGKGEKVDQIEVAADDGVSPAELRTALGGTVGPDVDLVTGAEEADKTKDQIQQGFGFFTTVLLVFAAIAVFVGAFIIFNTFSIIVAQRMREFGLLRAIGASQRQVTVSVLVEAAVIGLLASGLGVLMGLGAALGLQGLMDAIGVDLPTATLELEPRTVVVGFAVGLGVTFVSSVLPARRAAKVPPVAAMQGTALGTGRHKARRTYIGIALTLVGALLMGAGLLGMLSEELAAVGGGALLLFLGIATLSPVFARRLAGVLGSPLPRLFGVTGTLAKENSRRSPRRTSSTAAALMVGLALVTLVAMFASSLKGSIDSAMRKSMKADLVVMPQSFMSMTGFSPRIARQLEALPEVEIAAPFRWGEWKGSDGATMTAVAVEPSTLDRIMDVELTAGSLDALSDGGVLLRDIEADRLGLGAGDTLEMTFASTGKQSVPVDGIFEGGSNERYLLSLATYRENYARQTDMQVHVLGAAGVSTARLTSAVDDVVAAFPNVRVLDQTGLREESSKMIDQMLNMVYALLGLALIIAVLGITNTLALSVHERKREIGLLRAVGASRSQVRRMIRWEAAIIALFGSVLGVTIGTAFGWALIRTMEAEGFTEVVFPVAQIALFVVIAGLAGLLAAALPARRAANLNILNAIAFE